MTPRVAGQNATSPPRHHTSVATAACGFTVRIGTTQVPNADARVGMFMVSKIFSHLSARAPNSFSRDLSTQINPTRGNAIGRKVGWLGGDGVARVGGS